VADAILHHFASSPFSELLRLGLGLKRLVWKSVDVPMIAPKPDLVPLTGGYRKTPVLQIGANIYCGTDIAIEVLEALCPEPTFFPEPLGRLGALVGRLASGPIFDVAATSTMGLFVEQIPKDLLGDRIALFGFDPVGAKAAGPHLLTQFRAWMALTDDALGDGRAYLGGSQPGYADCAAAMNIWFQDYFGLKDERVAAFPNVAAWLARVEAIGHGISTEISSQDALDIAQRADPVVVEQVDADTGFAIDQPVIVRTEDPGATDIFGTLIRLTNRDVAILRNDPRIGSVAVHFPRLGQIVRAA
jgi:glutathione S-transferase